jgi:hypothetical protein
VYVTRFSAGPNTQAGQTGLLGSSLYRSLGEVFGVVLATPGPEALFVAGQSAAAVTLDPVTLAARWRERALASEVFVPELLALSWPKERVASLARELDRAAAAVGPTRDDRPVSFLHAITLRQEVAGSAWVPLLARAAAHPGAVAAGALVPSLVLVVWLAVLRPRRARELGALHATAVTGACGMAWSLMLFFSFQTRMGALYSELGALSAVFMLGLAWGGAWAGRAGARAPSLLRAQTVTLVVAALLAAALPALDRLSGWPVALGAAHVLLLGLSGVATGALLPSAARVLIASGRQPGTTAAAVALVDHLGAALAALFAAVLFVPVLGLAQTALLLFAWQLVAVLAGRLALRPGAARGGRGQR